MSRQVGSGLAATNGRHSNGFVHLRGALFSVLLVSISFPDVLFSHATLVNSAGVFGSLYQSPTTTLWPERQGRMYHHGLNDNGGAVWQSDPMRQYMRHVILGRESFYWNVYSATGALGPETLVDQKASPITLTAAVLGADQAAADATLLCGYALSIYALYLTVASVFGLSEGAAAAAGLIYLLNGFNVGNLGSNVSHAYVLFPLLLYALTSFVRKPSARRFALCVLANVLVLATTFLPVTFLTIAAVYILTGAYLAAVSNRHGVVANVRTLLLLGASAVMALLILAPLYFPIIESLFLLPSVESYAARVFFPAGYRNLIGLISPKHFWESYMAIDAHLLGNDAYDRIQVGNTVFHFGIVTWMIASLGFTAPWSRRSLILAAAALLCFIAIARIYDVPLLADAVGHTYGLRSIGCQYWFTVIGVTFPFLVAFGFDALRGRRRELLPLIVTCAIITAAFVLAGHLLGWVRERWLIQVWYLTVAALTTATAAWLIRGVHRHRARPRVQWMWKAGLLALAFTELTFYMNHLRPIRNDAQMVSPALVAFLKKSGNYGRLANFGHLGLPPEYGSAFRIPEVGSMNMSIFPWYKQLFEQAFMLAPERTWKNFTSLYWPRDPADLDDKILDLMAVKFLFVPKSWTALHEMLASRCYPNVYEDAYGTLYKNRNACPRIYAPRRLAPFQGVPSKMAENPCDTVFVEDPTLIAEALDLGIAEQPAPAAGPGASIEILKLRGAQVKFRASLPEPAIVIVADAWHPNWQTRVDGRKVYTGLVNGAFRGIALPTGTHLVEMRYRPRSLDAAQALSAAMLAGLALVLIRVAARASAIPSAPGTESSSTRTTRAWCRGTITVKNPRPGEHQRRLADTGNEEQRASPCRPCPE